MSKDLPPQHNLSINYKAINPKYNPETLHCRLEPQCINVEGKGSAISITNALKMLLNRRKEIVGQVSGLTMEGSLKDCFLIYCFGRAIHENTSQVNKNVLTYLITLGSQTLAEKCGLFSTSSSNIIPIAQLHATKTKDTISEIMRFWLQNALGEDPVVHDLLKHCHVYNLAYAKALYAMLNHSGWASILKPYLMCKCNKGDLRLAGSVCTLINNVEYTRLYNSLLTYWNDQQASRNDTYTYEMHRTWYNRYNDGMLHFDCLPSNFDIESIRFDTFHERCGTMKVMIGYIQSVLDNNYDGLTKSSNFCLH